ncbi:uncharacterized protein PWA37_000771 [Arxiozyma heterogenica]|uniref:non-specific serine/threonine protein kinase n=1 Tax=Arxiozyma heterogenica TaxID=278026 RepID=A0AAN7WHX2_9SACH|nr:hypothetical protein RI543_002298 [Kazachstania heterogenica]
MNYPNLQVYSPGVNLTVGSHNVEILKYLTSGGFAQIYMVKILRSTQYLYESELACLKRVIVPNKAGLNVLRAEVDAMKLLRNNKYIVSYIDSHAARYPLQNGTYEVFLLMEYCEKGGLIDFLNSRLQNRLLESEVLDIMSQVSQGVATMHALKPPLIHRDIKIENVLISKNNEFKLCDFGSVCGRIRPPNNQQEFVYVQNDILKNTTAQYRSPEMVDLNRRIPIDEKSDIWALGVFLYKLCYYTTPFEKIGENGILTSTFQFPSYPIYSDSLKLCISKMLIQDPRQRPNICQLIKEISKLQDVPCPIVNFYENQVPVVTTSSLLNINPYLPENFVDNIQLDHYWPNGHQLSQFYQKTTPKSATTENFEIKSDTDHKLNKAFSTPNLNLNSSEPNYKTKEVLTNKLKASIEEFKKDNEGSPELQIGKLSLPNDQTNDSSSEESEEQEILLSTDDISKETVTKTITSKMTTINDNNNYKSNDASISKSKKSFSEISHIAINQSNKKANLKDKKELSKKEIKLKMQMRLSEIGGRFKSTPNINLTKVENQISKMHSNNNQQNEKAKMNKKKPPIPKKPDHLRPQKPKKPSFLVGKSLKEVAGSTSRRE